MGFDIYEGVPLEVGDCDGAAYSLGDQTSIADGVYVAKEGIVVIDDGKVVAFFDHLKDTKGRKIEPCNCTSFEGYIEQIVKDGEEWRKAERQRIIDRYSRKVMENDAPCVVHHGDCRIWSIHPFCSCGLLHDLAPLPQEVIHELYPRYIEDCIKQAATEDGREPGQDDPLSALLKQFLKERGQKGI